jgi:hypothetical protein
LDEGEEEAEDGSLIGSNLTASESIFERETFDSLATIEECILVFSIVIAVDSL